MAALSSGFASAILVKLLDLLQGYIKNRSDEKLRQTQKKEAIYDSYIEEKKAVYIEALKKLSAIRAGFDVTYDFPYGNERINQMIDEINKEATTLSAKIRLYSSDDIYKLYWRLSMWSEFAFAPSSGAWHLGDGAKLNFSIYTTVLARLMQDDLGFRENINSPELVVCPNCGREHDAYKNCICGMTVIQTLDGISQGYREELERQMKDTEEDNNKRLKMNNTESENE